MRRQSEVCMIYGQRGSGKSFGARRKLMSLIEETDKVWLIFDNMEEHGNWPSEDRHSLALPKYRQTHSPSELADWLNELFEIDDFWEFEERPCEKGIIFSPRKVRYAENADYFANVCDVCVQLGNMILFIDELDMEVTLHTLPDELNYLIQYGRHHNMDVVGVSRSPAVIPKQVTSNATERHIYRVREANHLQYFYQCGLPREVMEIAPELQLGEHFIDRPGDPLELHAYPENIAKYSNKSGGIELFEMEKPQ